jgi:hypothetical protein
MDVRLALFLAFVLVFFIVLAVVAWFYLKRSPASRETDWDQLLAQLTFIDRDSVHHIALDLIDDSGQLRTDEDAMSLHSPEIWRMIGGVQGLEVMEKNCAVLIDLAFYLQRWYPEAMLLAEELRKNTREIQWHIDRLKNAVVPGKAESEFADYARPAIAIYYLMTRRLLALYETVDYPRLTQLQKTI